MTCVQCEDDTADRDSYVTYGGVIFCNWDCLAQWYVENNLGKSPEQIENSAKKVSQ